jgi:DNA-binding transcriptional MerR regulator
MSKQKWDKDYFTIKEFADFVGMAASALRHYDTTGVYVPAQRGAKGRLKYRYYSPTQITTVKVIRVLVDIGVPLDVIKEFASERTPESVLKLLSKHKNKVADDLRFLRDAYSIINTFTDLLTEAMCITENEITLAEMPAKQIILGGENDFTGETGFTREFVRFCNDIHEPMLNMSFPVGGYFESMAAFLDEPSRPRRFFSIDPDGHEQKAAGLYLTGYVNGYYGQTKKLPEQMAAFAKKKGLAFSGPVYNIYLNDEISVTDPEQYLLQVCASVRETRRVESRRPIRRT